MSRPDPSQGKLAGPARAWSPLCSFVTALAPRLEQGPREWAARRGDALVHDWLRSAARNTVILRDSDIKPIGVRKSFEHGLAATRAERRLPTDDNLVVVNGTVS